MSLSEFSLRRPVTTLMVYLTLFVLGGIAFLRIPREFLPSLEGPNFWIQIPFRDATPEEVERTVAVPAEELLKTVPRLSRIHTSSQTGSCSMTLEFAWGTEMDYAYLEVRDRLDRLKARLPRENREIFLWRFSSTDMEIMFLGFSGSGSGEDLFETVNDRIKPLLQRVDGVANVSVWGQEPRGVYVDLDQERLKAHGVSLYDLVARLDRSGFTLGSGEIAEGGSRYLVRTVHEFRSLEDLEEFRLNRMGLRLRDVASVGYGYPEKSVVTRMDGKASICVGIKKEAGANTVQVCRAVERELGRILAEPAFSGLGYSVIFDQADYILESFENLRESGLWGGAFALAVLYFFLRGVWPTLLVAVSIPVSILVAVMIMYFLSLTLNVISMVGLMLGVGMLVDNAIVVSENIFRLRERGMERREASRAGSNAVAMAIVASTLTTIIVFLPMVFMEMGIMKVYTREVGMAISLSLSASLFVALTFIPLVAGRLPGEMRGSRKSRVLQGLGIRYRHGLRWALRHRSQVICLVVLMIGLTVLVPFRRVPQKGEPTGDTRRIVLDVQVLGAEAQERIDQVLREVEEVLLAHRQELEIKHIFSQSGYLADRNRVHVFLRKEGEARRRTEELEQLLLGMLPDLPDVKFVLPEIHAAEGRAKDQLSLVFSGEDSRSLESLAERAAELLRGVEGVRQAESDAESGHDEIRIALDRSLAGKHRVNAMVAAQTIAFGLRGYPLRRMKEGDREVDVTVRLEREDRRDVSQLRDLQIPAEDGGLKPLGVVSRFFESPGQKAIRRSDGRRRVQVRIHTSGEPLSVMKRRVEQALASLELPSGDRMEFGDSLTEMEATRKTFGGALLFSVVLIYFLLGALLESYVHPLTILVSVPLALAGSYWVMYLTGSPMDVAAYIGLILMVGVVVNNAIVLVDRMNRLARSGLGREQAILQAGEDRIRPVLMTAATTVLGLVPLAFGGAGLGGMVMFAPLGKAVMGGLALSTLLTLFVVPVFFTLFGDAAAAWKRFLSVLRGAGTGEVGPG